MGTPGMRNDGKGGPPRAAMAAAMGARGELAGRREMEGLDLGHVEEGVGVLIVEGIEPRRPGRGDRRDGSVLGEEQSNDEIGARKKMSGGAGWPGELGGGEERSMGFLL